MAARPGITNPGALAASIGRKKYGAKKFDSLAHHIQRKGPMMDDMEKPAGKSMMPKGKHMMAGMPMKKGMPETMLPKRKSLRLRLKRRGGH